MAHLRVYYIKYCGIFISVSWLLTNTLRKYIYHPGGCVRGLCWTLGSFSVSLILSVLQVGNTLAYLSINNREPPVQQLTNYSVLHNKVLLLVPVSTASRFSVCSINVCLFLLFYKWFFFLLNGMFPGNHGNSEVAAGNATVYFLFSLFLKGEELLLPIYSICVCVNTFILNLKLIKYHLSLMSPEWRMFLLRL